MSRFKSMDSVTVLTTAEHVELFRSVFGPKADYRFNPKQTAPLEMFLTNLTLGGGTIAVLDEAHFISAEGMVQGIKRYTNSPQRVQSPLRLIVVCPKRTPGDPLLFELAALCGVYDLVYDETSMDVIVALKQLTRRENQRSDILELLDLTEMQEPHPPQPCSEVFVSPGQKLIVKITVETE